MTFEEEWRPHITAARKAEAARYAAAPIAPRYAEDVPDTLDPFADPYETHPWGSGPDMMMKGVLL